ncbi:MAG TPA: serine/threonine protein kinase [Candidatus Eremiobacteraeota bacterium]|nr:MAG: 3-deoxy-D-manno-octulosonic-acid kinase [bacterium ADurb.Bin363]HPZ06528.1 serine/threonine protein kinase [Candidatus Eremiobacteraeota bacterium]
MSVQKAILKDGRTVEFVWSNDPPAGGMKKTYFSPDKSYVVQFFHDLDAAKDPHRMTRLEAILGKYNPTVSESQGGARGVTPVAAEYFKKLFCWPTGIVVTPELGIVAPCYPKNYFFATGPFQGKEKEGKWFSSPKLRKYLPDDEKGTWINYFKICILIARAVRRLHQAGLAHSDLSCKNILIDPSIGTATVIDIDSLVVPQLFPPDVMGTPGYIAPEVLATQHLSLNDPNRQHPCSRTDQHALAVLVYEYLLFRHPLQGPKVNSTTSAEEDELLSMGSKALFVEHPTDQSNRPADLKIPFTVLGNQLGDLFTKAFIPGLHEPNDRPAAIEWERGLIKTWDMLLPCGGNNCTHKWFILTPGTTKCPFCNTKYQYNTIPILKLRTERRPGQWMNDGQLTIYHNLSVFKWHAFDNVFPGEEADRTPQAYCAFHQGQWIMVNQALSSLTSPGGNRVPPGQAVVLSDGAQIRLSQEPHGRIAEVQIQKI